LPSGTENESLFYGGDCILWKLFLGLQTFTTASFNTSVTCVHNAIICGIDHLQHKNALSMSDQFCKGCVHFHDPDTLVNPKEKGYCVPHWPVQPLLVVASIEDYINYNPTLSSSSWFFFSVVEMEDSGTCFLNFLMPGATGT
jgi:hypothetical protein